MVSFLSRKTFHLFREHVGQGDGAGAAHLKQPFGRQCPAELRRRVVDAGAIAPPGGLDQELGGILPERPELMALGQREHELSRLAKGRDRATVLKFDRYGELACPWHAAA